MATIFKFCRIFTPFVKHGLGKGQLNNVYRFSHPRQFSLFRPLGTDSGHRQEALFPSVKRRYSEEHEWVVVEGKVGKIGISDFAQEHEWVVVEGKVGKIGISDFAQDKLGDIVYVQLPEVDDEFEQHDECGAVESVKAASELFTPVSGKVVETNTVVEEKPALINQSPYDEGWLFKVELSKPEEYNDLMDEEAYQSFLKRDED